MYNMCPWEVSWFNSWIGFRFCSLNFIWFKWFILNVHELMSNLKCIICTLKCKAWNFSKNSWGCGLLNVHKCQFILHCFGNVIFKTEWSLLGYFPRVLWEQLSPQAELKAVWQQACGQSLALLVSFDSLCPSHLLLPWISVQSQSGSSLSFWKLLRQMAPPPFLLSLVLISVGRWCIGAHEEP